MPKTFCYVVYPDQMDENGFFPSVIYSGLTIQHALTGKGLRAVPHYWGKTWEEAQRICRERNEGLGLTKEDVADIIASSEKAREKRRKSTIDR
jgi:hypothetical protein